MKIFMPCAPAKVLPAAILVLCCALAGILRAQDSSAAKAPNSLTIDLKNALERARNNSPQLQSASLGVESVREDRVLAKAALLPTLSYLNQYLYTQGNGTPSGVFVANDGVHIYNSQAVVHQELFSPARLAEYRRAVASQALAEARKEIVTRGLDSTVVQSYYAVVTAQRKKANAEKSLEEARRFVDITEKLERGGEVAHSDFVKAQLVLQQRQRDIQDVLLAVEKAHIALAVLLFPDYRTDFALVDDLNLLAPLPAYEGLQSLAKEKNPELRAAEESVRQEQFGISIARTAYLPTLNLDYFFGINANQFAINSGDRRNLGSFAQATLNIPIWNWRESRSKVRQAEYRSKQAQLDLDLARRQFDANLRSLYLEAQSALAQVDSLRRTEELAAESLRLTAMRYVAGEVTVLEVVDAESTLAQARNANDEGQARYRLALANLQILSGTY